MSACEETKGEFAAAAAAASGLFPPHGDIDPKHVTGLVARA